jgi:hypothetical protein
MALSASFFFFFCETRPGGHERATLPFPSLSSLRVETLIPARLFFADSEL